MPNKWESAPIVKRGKWDEAPVVGEQPSLPEPVPTFKVQGSPQGSPIEQIWNAPNQRFDEAQQFYREGNLPAGNLKTVSGIAQKAAAPFGMVSYMVENMPPQYGGGMTGPAGALAIKALGAIPTAVGWTAENLLGGLLHTAQGAGIPIKEETIGAAKEAAGSVAPWLTPKIVGGAAKAWKRNVAPAIELSRLDVGRQGLLDIAPPSKAKAMADQSRFYRQEVIPRASKYVAQKAREVKPKDIQEFGDMVSEIKNDLWDKVSVRGKPLETVTVNPASAVDQAIAQLPDNVQQLHPELVDKIRTDLERYRQPMTMGVLENEIRDLNAKQSAYWRANDVVKAQMENADPKLASKVLIADALRDVFFSTVEQNGFKGMANFRKDWGAVSQLDRTLQGNMERNLALDKKSQWDMFNNPMRKGLWSGVMARLFGFGPGVAAVADLGTIGIEMARRHMARPSTVARRTADVLSRTSVAPADITYVPIKPIGLLPPAQFRMGGVSGGFTPSGQPYNRANVVTGQFQVPTLADFPNRLLPPRRGGDILEGSSYQPPGAIRDYGTNQPGNPWIAAVIGDPAGLSNLEPTTLDFHPPQRYTSSVRGPEITPPFRGGFKPPPPRSTPPSEPVAPVVPPKPAGATEFSKPILYNQSGAIKWSRGLGTIELRNTPKTKGGLGGKKYVAKYSDEAGVTHEYSALTKESAEKWLDENGATRPPTKQ